MYPGINPSMMKQAMKKLGIKQEEIDAEIVIIKTKDKEIIIENPSVAKIDMQGNETFQISGDISERAKEIEISEEDIATVIEQTNCSKEEALKAIKETNGDLAEAILKLSES